jgi:hypothetical protein
MPKARVPDGAGYRSPVAVSGPVLFLPVRTARSSRSVGRECRSYVQAAGIASNAGRSAARIAGMAMKRPERS